MLQQYYKKAINKSGQAGQDQFLLVRADAKNKKSLLSSRVNLNTKDHGREVKTLIVLFSDHQGNQKTKL